MRKRKPTEFRVGMRIKFSVPTPYLFPDKRIKKKKIYLYGKIVEVSTNAKGTSIIVNCKYKNKRHEYHLGSLGRMFIGNPNKDVYLCK